MGVALERTAMTERARWAVGDGGAVVRVTRIVGGHESGEDRERRYVLDFPAADPAWDAVSTRRASADRTGDEFRVTVADGARLGRVRCLVGGETLAVRLPGPVLGEAVEAATRGDEEAARTVRNAFDDPVSIPFCCGSFLDLDGVADLVAALADARRDAADALHGARYDLARTAAVSRTGLAAPTVAAFERFVARLDDVEAIGSLDPLDALGGALATVPGADAALDRLTALGYDPASLAARDDGRFLAVLAANRVLSGGREAARDTVRDYGDVREEYDRAKSRALSADYWERGRAWRDALGPAVTRSLDEFSFALANALHWTGEVSRADSRVDELLHDAAAAVAAAVDLAGVEGRARFARHQAAGHRHRNSHNHDFAVQHFDRARDVATDHDALAAWEPRYSRSVVRSNQLATRGRFRRAVDVLDDALDALADRDVPPNRREEVTHHLEAQKRERQAAVDADDPGVRRVHLEAARDHFERAGFDRSAARVDRKLERADRDAGDGAETRRRVAPPERTVGTDRRTRVQWGDRVLGDAPLDDELTDHDPDAVGSVDPGVLPDDPDSEHGGDRRSL